MTQKIAHYNILERLGGGALGDVYRARDTKVGRTVALMQPSAAAPLGCRRAARASSRTPASPATLNHPNIAALFDVVEEDGRCYLAYEFAAGPSLRQEMSGVRLGVRRAVELAAQIADALAEGHTRGIVHGDLRPDTVVVTPKGSAKILNFGMVPWTAGGSARSDGGAVARLAHAGEASVAGYLSPEQALGGHDRCAQRSLFAWRDAARDGDRQPTRSKAATPSTTVTNLVRARRAGALGSESRRSAGARRAAGARPVERDRRSTRECGVAGIRAALRPRSDRRKVR